MRRRTAKQPYIKHTNGQHFFLFGDFDCRVFVFAGCVADSQVSVKLNPSADCRRSPFLFHVRSVGTGGEWATSKLEAMSAVWKVFRKSAPIQPTATAISTFVCRNIPILIWHVLKYPPSSAKPGLPACRCQLSSIRISYQRSQQSVSFLYGQCSLFSGCHSGVCGKQHQTQAVRYSGNRPHRCERSKPHGV